MRILGLFLILIVITQNFWAAAILSIGAYLLFRPNQKTTKSGGENHE